MGRKRESPGTSVPFITTLDCPSRSDPCYVAPDPLGQHTAGRHGWLLAAPASTLQVFPADPCLVTKLLKGLVRLQYDGRP